SGADRFTWKVNDGRDDSAVAVVTIVVDGQRSGKAGQKAKFYFPPPGEALANQARRKPEEAGLKPEVIGQLRALMKNGRWALWRHGYLVHVEGDFNQTTEVASLRKTWHAMAVGAAIKQGKIPSYKQKLSVWNRELTGKDAEATWRHVITQTSGFDYPYGDFPALKPGEIWTYSDKNPKQLCNALARVYGKKDYRDNYDEVIRQAYFDAIGMRGWTSSAQDDGIRFQFDLEDMGRLGLLALARGRWNGVEVIPQWFVEELEKKQTRGIRANYDGPDDGRPKGGWLHSRPRPGRSQTDLHRPGRSHRIQLEGHLRLRHDHAKDPRTLDIPLIYLLYASVI
ncbi:MAG: serine hydrolase, partial [Blastocatellia bacterium]